MICPECRRADCNADYWRRVVDRGDARNASGVRVARDHPDAVRQLSCASLLCRVRRLIAAKVETIVRDEERARRRASHRVRRR